MSHYFKPKSITKIWLIPAHISDVYPHLVSCPDKLPFLPIFRCSLFACLLH